MNEEELAEHRAKMLEMEKAQLKLEKSVLHLAELSNGKLDIQSTSLDENTKVTYRVFKGILIGSITLLLAMGKIWLDNKDEHGVISRSLDDHIIQGSIILENLMTVPMYVDMMSEIAERNPDNKLLTPSEIREIQLKHLPHYIRKDDK